MDKTRDALAPYHRKRDFSRTPEPSSQGGRAGGSAARLSFVIQKHHATRLHYDFRLELDGTLKSWAVPKGPSLDPSVKRMAVQVEDHPLSYGGFEGTIPAGNYGAGRVILWDRGEWEPVGDPHEGLAKGDLKFNLYGHKLQGRWVLVRIKGKGDEKQPPWLLIKERDSHVRPESEYDVLEAMPDSVAGLPKTKDAGAAARGAKKKADKPAAKAKLPPRAALPATFSPQLATLVDAPPQPAADWLYELKVI